MTKLLKNVWNSGKIVVILHYTFKNSLETYKMIRQ